MLDINYHPSILASPRQFPPNRGQKHPVHHNTVLLQFKADRTTFGRFKRNRGSPQAHCFRTFYSSKDSHCIHRYLPSKAKRNGRDTAFTDRESVIGTPFSSLQLNNNEILTPVLPALDRERYRYLLTAITGLSKQKKLPDFKTPLELNQLQSINDTSTIAYQSNLPSQQIGSPRIINVSADFKPAQRSGLRLQLDNSYQKTAKNKRLLQKGRYHSFRQSSPLREELIVLGDEELKVRQMPIKYRKVKNRELA